PGINFGNFLLVQISGRVFQDTNGDGAPQAGEPAAAGWVVELDKNANGTVDQTATTDANGNYSFSGLGNGIYRLRLRGQTGWTQSSLPIVDIQAESGTNATGRNFGVFRLITINGQVYYDVTGNGILNAGDLGLAGRLVQLDIGADGGVDDTATTGA